MQIHRAERRVSLSVGELAGFRLGPAPAHEAPGRWRMALGSAWHSSLHQELQKELQATLGPQSPPQSDLAASPATAAAEAGADPNAKPSAEAADGATATATVTAADTATTLQTEVTLGATLLCGNWRFELSGRVDQIIHSGNTVTIREIKTTERPLPLDLQEVEKAFPHYLRQLALYLALYEQRLPATTPAPSAPPAPRTTNTGTSGKSTGSQPARKSAKKSAASTAPAGSTAPADSSRPTVSTATTISTTATATTATTSAHRQQTPQGELLVVNIHTGERQSIFINSEKAQTLCRQALENLLPFLEERSRVALAPQQQALPRAFEHYRDGQPEALEQLRARLLGGRACVFEAPTGFGKTGIALEVALEQLRNGVFDRVIYLSGKTTGQHQVMRQLRLMNPAGGTSTGWRIFQLRSRREHTETALRQRRSQPPSIPPADQPDSWEAFGIFPHKLLDQQRADTDSLRQLAARTGLCAYELAKACLPYADVWVGDYNYVFSDRHRRVFFEQPGFNPAQTLLIIDEAHNLPSRVADNHSLALSASQAEAVAMDLRLNGAPALLVLAWEQWTAFLQGIKPGEEHQPQLAAEALVLLTRLCALQDDFDLPALPLQPFSREAMGETHWQARLLADNAHPRLVWSARQGVLNVTTLEAPQLIGQTLAQFGASLLMSATVGPHDIFSRSLGLGSQQVDYIGAQAHWRDNAYDVAIDTTVDTRLRSRASFYQQTADTIGRFSLGARGPLTVFFPSYQYAETVLKYLEALHPALIVKVQPRAIDPGGQLTFVEESLLLAHVLFFVLGSSFSESIDHLGGRVDRAIVVGPALPEVNPVQNARLKTLEELGREEAFRRVYQIPALQKINQALGRLVRAPGQSARVLLHDFRFAQPSYRELLAPEYRNARPLTTPDALYQWLND